MKIGWFVHKIGCHNKAELPNLYMMVQMHGRVSGA